jgi:hypothetical protein
MKRTTKKKSLEISTEKLRELSGSDLTRAQGGVAASDGGKNSTSQGLTASGPTQA